MLAANKLFFDVITARQFLYMEPGEVVNGFEVIEISPLEKWNRWSVCGTVTIRDASNGAYYQGWYSEGATEYQSDEPWDDENEAEFVRVEPKEHTITVYVPVESE